MSEIVDFLSSDKSDLRRAAAYALGDMRASEAAEALRRLASDPDIEVRKAAARALEAME
jgi:HEAT repeat protein